MASIDELIFSVQIKKSIPLSPIGLAYLSRAHGRGNEA